MPDSIIGTNKFTVREYISGYRICKCQLSNGKSVTVVGNIPATKNLKLKYIGEWEVHSKYGKQFKAASYMSCRKIWLWSE